METDEVLAEASKITIGETSLTLMQKGSIRSVVRVFRLVAGTEKSSNTFDVEERLEKAEKEVIKLNAQMPSVDATVPQVQLKHVFSEGSEEVAPKISSRDLTNHWDTFKAVFGRDPRSEEECTAEQLTGIDVLLKRDTAPHVDFSIWGPNPQAPEKAQEHWAPTSRRRNSASSGCRESTRFALVAGMLQPVDNRFGGIRSRGTRASPRLRPLHRQVCK